jgi:predicted PurR-regulated permease PerM
MKRDTLNKSTVLLLVGFVSAVFLSMIRQFLMAILVAGIFSALARPLYHRFERWFGGRRALASTATLLLLVAFVLLPLGALLGVVVTQAIHVGQSVTPWIQKQVAEPTALTQYLKAIPFYDDVYGYLAPYQDLIMQKAGAMVAGLSKFLINSLSSVTVLTVNLLFTTFILLYTMFFFLMDGDKLLSKILYYLPLEDQDEERLLERFTSVTRATIKGTVVIGIVQGGLAGAAFVVVGIPSAVFWATIMTVLSIIPGVGTALVWLPASIILAAGGAFTKAIGLALFCAVLVGSVDNFLRPLLVGKDTKLHELLILFGTLGGIIMFGVVGLIIGPVLAALFVTVWEIYGVVFRDVLPATRIAASQAPEESQDEQTRPDTDKG